MSHVNAAPGTIGSTATNLAGIGATISRANAVAAAPTTGLVASARDQVSAAVAAFFNGHAQGYQTLGAQAEAFHQDFVQLLRSGAGAYAAAESDNVAATGSTVAEPAVTTKRESVGRSDNHAAGHRPEVAGSTMEGNRGSGAPPGGESRSAATGLIGVGAAGRVGVPTGESGGRATRWLSGAEAGRPRIAGPALSARKSDSSPLSSPSGLSARQLAGPVADRPRGGATVVILNSRGGGSGGMAHGCRTSMASRGSGGAGGVYCPPVPTPQSRATNRP